MLNIIRIQFQLLFSKTSQFIYLIMVCCILGVFFALFSPMGKKLLPYILGMVASSQLAPMLFSLEKENKTFETSLTLPLHFKVHIAAKKWFYCIVTVGMIAISYIVMDSVKLMNGLLVKEELLDFKLWLSLYILPLVMVSILGLKMSLLSLNAKESRACAMDASLAAIIYGMPCLIQMVCSSQTWIVWGTVALLYLIIELILGLLLTKKMMRSRQLFLLK